MVRINFGIISPILLYWNLIRPHVLVGIYLNLQYTHTLENNNKVRSHLFFVLIPFHTRAWKSRPPEIERETIGDFRLVSALQDECLWFQSPIQYPWFKAISNFYIGHKLGLQDHTHHSWSLSRLYTILLPYFTVL